MYQLLNRPHDSGHVVKLPRVCSPLGILLNDPRRAGSLTTNTSKFHDITNLVPKAAQVAK